MSSGPTAPPWRRHGLVTKETTKLAGSDTRIADYTYNSKGEMLTSTLDPSGLNILARFVYDGAGNLTQSFDPNAPTTTTASAGTTATYDSGDRLLTIRMPLVGAGARGGADYVYDTHGRLYQLKVLKGDGTTYAVSTIGYSETSRPVSVTDPQSHATAFEYDSEDRLSKVTDADTKNTVYEYWPDNKVERIKKAVGTGDAQTYARMWHDFAGRKLAQRPARGNALNSGAGGTTFDTNYGFDEYSRQSVTYFPDATQEQVFYNANGTVERKRTRNVASPSGGEHNDIRYEYDASQRLVRQYESWTNRTPLVRNERKTEYDLANRVTRAYER